MKRTIQALTLGTILVASLFGISAAAADGPEMSSVITYLDAGEYSKALGVIDTLLKEHPKHADLCHARITALSSLGKHNDAAKFALGCTRKFPDDPRFRYEAGMEAYAMGAYPQAIGQWSKIYGDPVWGESACIQAADALTLQGKPEKALATLRKAIEGKEHPSPKVLNRMLDVESDVAEGSKILDLLIGSDSENKSSYEALKRLYAAAGPGKLREEIYPGQGSYTIPLKEKSEFVDTTSFSWEGGGDSKSMRMGSSARVVLSASIDGSKPKWMAIGSGIQAVMISPKALKELGLEVQSTKRQLGLGYFSEEPMDWVLIKNLKIGDLEYRNVPAMVIGGKYAGFWKETVGAIPYCLFDKHSIHFNRREGKFTLMPPGSSPVTAMGEGTYLIQSKWEGGRPYVSTVLQEQRDKYFLLDTGAIGTYLSAEMVGGMGLDVTTTGSSNDLDRTLSRGFLYPTASPLSTPTVSVGAQGAVTVSGRTQLAVSLPMMETDRKNPEQEGMAKEVSIVVGKAAIKMPNVPVAKVGLDQEFGCYGILGRNITDLFEIFLDSEKGVVAFKDYKK